MKSSTNNFIPKLSKGLGKSEINYFDPKAIYSLNRVLKELVDELAIRPPMDVSNDKKHHGDVHAWVNPYFFDCHKRTWHFANVLPHVWTFEDKPDDDITKQNRDLEDKVELAKEVLWLLTRIAVDKDLYNQFSMTKYHLLAGRDYLEAYERICDWVRRIKEILGPAFDRDYDWTQFKIDKETEEKAAFEEFIDIDRKCFEKLAAWLKLPTEYYTGSGQAFATLIRDLLLIYHGLRNHRNTYIPGILYRDLHAQSDEPISHFEGYQIRDTSLTVSRCLVTLKSNKPLSCGDNGYEDKNQFQYDHLNGVKTPSMDDWPDSRGIKLGLALTRPFFLRRLLEEQKQSEEGKLYVILLPIHDVWVGGVGYGGLWGALLCTFSDIKDKEKFELEKLDRLRNMCEVLADELGMSALATVTSLPIIAPYDLVEHFVRVIVHMQDWDRVSVFRRRGKEKTLLYRYRRCLDRSGLEGRANDTHDMDFSLDFSWQRCDCNEASDCMLCSELMKSKKRSEYLSWNRKDCEIWSSRVMPELTQDEKFRFSDIVIEFDHPPTAVIPQKQDTDDKIRELFELTIIRQQIEVLRALIPKVRARRAAARAAVSAIMGRNMSHNIGSHVLARYSSNIMKDLDRAKENCTDHRAEFLRYLQRRMDFLAEVGTSEKAFWSQPLSLKRLLARLNLKAQYKQCFNDDSEGHALPKSTKENKPILLTYITGKESLLASVEYGGDLPKSLPAELQVSEGPDVNDFLFSCPGGEVGAHALFIILENIIRNSARHGSDQVSGVVRIHIYVDSKRSKNDLLKLVIVDSRTLLGEYGQKLSDVEDDVSALHEELKEVAAGKHSKYDSSGIRIKRMCLVNEINSILKGEPFLDMNGIPNPQFWGVREIQICANYLRRIPLSDIESENGHGKYALKAVRLELGDSYCLGYELYIQRAKLLGVITSNKDLEAHALSDRGIDVICRDLSTSTDGTSFDTEGWNSVIASVRGYGFVAVTPEISIPEDKMRSLPYRCHTLDIDCIENLLQDAKQCSTDSLEWMEKLHRIEGCRYRDLRPAWNIGGYWGLYAKEVLKDKCEVTTGNWRIVGMNRNYLDEFSMARPMYPLKNLHSSMVKSLDESIAAAWIDHPKPGYFASSSSPEKQKHTKQKPGVGFWQAVENKKRREAHRRWIHVEGIFNDSPHKEPLEACSESGLCEEFLAAALPRVAVLDERVQSGVDIELREIPLRSIWPSIGVWVPDENDCNLDSPILEDIQKFLGQPSERDDQWPVDFLVLHLTVLERLHKARPDQSWTLAETLDALTSNTEARDAQVIIVTGRGVPPVTRSDDPDFLPGARYLPISAVLEYLVARPSKLALMRVLWSAARPPNR